MSVKELYAFIKYIGKNMQYGYIIYKIYNLSVIDRFIYRLLLINEEKVTVHKVTAKRKHMEWSIWNGQSCKTVSQHQEAWEVELQVKFTA